MRMSDRHCELRPARCPTAGMKIESAVGASGLTGTTGVTRLIDTGTDFLLLALVTMRRLPLIGEVDTITVAVNVPFGSCAGSIVTFSTMPSGGRIPLDGLIFTIHGRSDVATKFSFTESPGICTLIVTRSALPAGTLMFGFLRFTRFGTMTTRIVFEKRLVAFPHPPVARTR